MFKSGLFERIMMISSILLPSSKWLKSVKHYVHNFKNLFKTCLCPVKVNLYFLMKNASF
jgi:hypothetical protein